MSIIFTLEISLYESCDNQHVTYDIFLENVHSDLPFTDIIMHSPASPHSKNYEQFKLHNKDAEVYI